MSSNLNLCCFQTDAEAASRAEAIGRSIEELSDDLDHLELAVGEVMPQLS